MSAPQKYGRAIFELAVERLSPSNAESAMELHEVRDDGVYLRPIEEISDVKLLVDEYDGLTWHPRRDISLPALPFPFTVPELAAFCFPVLGSPLIAFYEDGEAGGLDPEKLKELGQNGRVAAQVLTEAHALLIDLNARFYPAQQEKQSVLIAPSATDPALRASAQSSVERKAARRATREREAEQAAAQEDAALKWLLEERESEATLSEQAASSATGQHVRYAGQPAPIPTGAMCAALNGVHGKDAAWWRNTLANAPKWLHVARVHKGSPPRPTTWDPIALAKAVGSWYGIPPANLRGIFQRRELADWLPAWTEELKEISHLRP